MPRRARPTTQAQDAPRTSRSAIERALPDALRAMRSGCGSRSGARKPPCSRVVRAGRRLAQHASAARNDARIEVGAVLRRALLVLEVDMHDAEALRIAMRPFEIVQQRPREVAA